MPPRIPFAAPWRCFSTRSCGAHADRRLLRPKGVAPMSMRYENRPTKRRLILIGGVLAAAVIFIHCEVVHGSTLLTVPERSRREGIPQESNFTLEGKITEKSAGKLTLS